MPKAQPIVLKIPKDEAERKDAEDKARDAFIQARIDFLRGRATGNGPKDSFFATLSINLDLRVDWSIPTAATDGRSLFYNPAFVNCLSHKFAIGVMAHEVLHPAMCHHTRRAGRCPKKWNAAADCAINQILKAEGFNLPDGCIELGKPPFEGAEPDQCAEYYYNWLQDHPGGSLNEAGGDDPGQCGGVMDAPGGEAKKCEHENEWKRNLSAAVAKAEQEARKSQNRGTLPGWMQNLVGQLLYPKVSWTEVLREFVTSCARNDYTFRRPNRRFIGQNQILPGLQSEELGEVVVAIDTSGSCYCDAVATRFCSELQGILDAFNTKVTVIYCDAAVSDVKEWNSTDGPLSLDMRQMGGGGGTSHIPVFEKISELGLDPKVCILLTDLFTEFPEHAPTYPCIWTVYGGIKASEAPFGQTIHIED